MDENFVEVVRKTEKALIDYKAEWQKAFCGYAEEIRKRLKDYEDMGKKIKKELMSYQVKYNLDEVQLYSSVTRIKKSGVQKRSGYKAYYALRFCGQHICTIVVTGNTEPQLLFKEEDNRKNKEWLKIEKDFEGDAIKIKSTEAEDFFKKLGSQSGTTKSPEHELESLVLREIAKTKGEEKLDGFRYIKPIKLGEGFFQMPTPLKASSHEPIISIRKDGGAGGGGIDILAKMSAPKTLNNWSLCVIELKDENKKNEPVNEVIEQALIYATFIAYLLADEKCGKEWYNIFRWPSKVMDVPQTIDISVIAMMPPSEDSSKDEIDGEIIKLKVGGKTINLRPHTAFVWKKEGMAIKNTTGTYLEIKKPYKIK